MGYDDTIKSAIKTDPPRLGLEDNLRTAIEKVSCKDCSGAIVEANGEMIGIVSEMDLMQAVSSNRDLDDTKVADIMTTCELIRDKLQKTPCVQLDEDQSVFSGLKVMTEAGVHNLLVSGAGDKVIGLASASDLLKKLL